MVFSRRVYVASSNVLYIAYSDEDHILEVAYKWGGVYTYEHVPVKFWYSFLNAESKGKWVWANLRSNATDYPYTLNNYGPEEVVSERILKPEDRKKPWWKRIKDLFK